MKQLIKFKARKMYAILGGQPDVLVFKVDQSMHKDKWLHITALAFSNGYGYAFVSLWVPDLKKLLEKGAIENKEITKKDLPLYIGLNTTPEYVKLLKGI